MSKGRRVYLQGKCYLKHVSYLKQMLNSPKGTPRCTALCVNGACGLPDWSVKAEKGFEVVSARSDIPYTVEDIRASLMQIASCAPSMTLLVHLGNDWDKIGCIATVRVRGRMVDVLPPMMDKKEEPEKIPADFDLKTLFFPIKK